MAAGVEDERYQQSGVVGMEVDRTATKPCGGRLGGRPRGSGAGQRAHQQRQVEAGDVDQVALGDVVAPAQPGSSHAAAVEDVSEGAFAQFGAELEGGPGDAAEQAGAVVVDRAPSPVVAAPAQQLAPLGFADARLPRAAVQILEHRAAVIALVGNEFGGRLVCRVLRDEKGWPYCLLFADVDSAPANRLYQRVGFKLLHTFQEYDFED